MDSRERRNFLYITFATVHQAIEAEELLNLAHISCLVVPTPLSVSRSCGIALRVPLTEEDKARELIVEKGIQFSGFHYLP